MKKLLSINGVTLLADEVQAVSWVADDYVHGPSTYRKVFKVFLKGGVEVAWTGARYNGNDPVREMACREAAQAAREQVIDALWPGRELVLET